MDPKNRLSLTDVDDGFLIECRYLIHDRDPLRAAAFPVILNSATEDVTKLPTRSLNLNAYTERFVRSIKYECLGRMIPMGERHLREVVSECVDHYCDERNHQGLDTRLIDKPSDAPDLARHVERRQRPCGILNYYYRDAE
ncbi:MAG: putative transposase [Gammaproteobacteria bacterium]|jgi:putative transposase